MASSINSQRLCRLGQYASSPGNRTYCYVSSLAVAVAVAIAYFAYPQRDGQAELGNVLCIICYRDFKVSSVINAGDSIPTEVFIFCTADDACEYWIVELFFRGSAQCNHALDCCRNCV